MSRLSEVNHIVFWQPNISVHSLPLYQSLAKTFKVEFCVIDKVSHRRASMGWKETNISNTSTFVLSESKVDNIEQFNKLDSKNTIHLFSGIRAYKPIYGLMRYANRKGSLFAIISETQDWIGLKGFVRRVLSSYEAIKLKKNVSFILGIGHTGKRWFESTGFPKEKIFEWAYFTEKEIDLNLVSESRDPTIKLVFIGRFVKVKGVDWLLNSLVSLKQYNFELHLIGDGPEREKLFNRYNTLLKDKIIFHGAVNPDSVKSYLKNMDYLILPSVGKDGWGAVINEALSQGVPVIVSEFAGASTLVKRNFIGHTINPNKPDSLIKLLKYILASRVKIPNRQRLLIKDYARNLTGEKGAEYFIDILNNLEKDKVIIPPWNK